MISLFNRRSGPRQAKPMFSVVIISYNMAREIPRTVQSFLPPYQMGVSNDEIEIIVMENGSSAPIDPSIVNKWPNNVRYIKAENPHPSPAKALNEGVKMAKANWVCPVIDGARMVSPGIFKAAKTLIKAQSHEHVSPIIATIGRHLGDKVQFFNVREGYDQDAEDALLRSINWPNEPYRLFDISCVGGSAQGSWLLPIAESNVLIMAKTLYENLGGYDQSFDIAGGGLVNLDFFKRAIEHKNSQYYLLLGEASFHQYHGGVTTSRPVSDPSLEDKTVTTWEIYARQYKRIRGADYAKPTTEPILHGPMTKRVQAEALAATKYIKSIKPLS